MNIGRDTLNFRNLGKINVLLGKNGSGKSTLLKQAQDSFIDSDQTKSLDTMYITPERGGVLIHDPNVDNQVSSSKDQYLKGTRNVNQFTQFRQQTFAQFRDFETEILREIANEQRDNKEYTFEKYVDKINSLLDNIKINTVNRGFRINQKQTGGEIDASSISSGESEIISLAIECLVFHHKKSTKPKILFIDEPDVHLHPDLQVKFMKFLEDLTLDHAMKVIVATHSTALLGALGSKSDLRVGFMKSGDKDIDFKKVDQTYRDILPIFGAHPLSNIFNETPILLVEGEDDERIWQSTIRSSNGLVKIYPCQCGGVTEMPKYETDVISIVTAVYDNAVCYSLRDRDDQTTEPVDKPPLVRMMLCCRNAENLMLTDEVLANLPIKNWDNLKLEIDAWIAKMTSHKYHNEMKLFQGSSYNRKSFDLKSIRNILIDSTQTPKSWEIAVGQALAKLTWSSTTDFSRANSLHNYLGEKITKTLFPKV